MDVDRDVRRRPFLASLKADRTTRASSVCSRLRRTRRSASTGKAIMLSAPGGERVRPHHLLLAMVDDQEGVGAPVLTQLGATTEKLRAAIDKETKG